MKRPAGEIKSKAVDKCQRISYHRERKTTYVAEGLLKAVEKVKT